MIEAGDVSHLKWRKDYECDVEKAKKLGVEKYFKEIEIEIQKVEERLQLWEEELKKFRMGNSIVNHFTVKQMLVLRKFLIKFSSNASSTKPTNQVFALLKTISQDVQLEKIKKCCRLMYAQVTQKNPKSSAEVSTNRETNFTRFSYKELQTRINKYLQEDDDIDESLIFASLMQVADFSNERKVFLWCRKNKDDEDLVEKLSETAEMELEKMKENSLR